MHTWISFREGDLIDPSQTPYWMLVARIFYLKLGYRLWIFCYFSQYLLRHFLYFYYNFNCYRSRSSLSWTIDTIHIHEQLGSHVDNLNSAQKSILLVLISRCGEDVKRWQVCREYACHTGGNCDVSIATFDCWWHLKISQMNGLLEFPVRHVPVVKHDAIRVTCHFLDMQRESNRNRSIDCENEKSSRKRYWEKKTTGLKNISEIGYGNKAQFGQTCCLPFIYLYLYTLGIYMWLRPMRKAPSPKSLKI